MAQFERIMAPSEQDVAKKLKSYIADVQDHPQQVVKRSKAYFKVLCTVIRGNLQYVCMCMFL